VALLRLRWLGVAWLPSMACVYGSGLSEAKGIALGSRVVEGHGGAHGDGMLE
jgi:hypothetical protein